MLKLRAKNAQALYTIVQSLFWLTHGLMFAFAAVYLQKRGFSSGGTGAVLGCAYALSALLQPAIASLFSRRHIAVEQGMCAVHGIVIALSLLLLLLPLSGLGVALLIVPLFSLEYALQPCVDTLARRWTSMGCKVDYGASRGLGSLLYAGMTAGMGLLLQRISPLLLPLFYLVTLALSVAILWILDVPKTADAIEDKDSTAAGARQAAVHRSRFALFLAGVGCVSLGHVLVENFMLQIMQAIGGNSGHLGIAISIASLVEFPAMLMYSRLSGRFGAGRLLIFSAWAWAAKNLLILIARAPAMIYLAEILQFASYGIYIPASIEYVAQIFSERELLKGQSLVGSVYTVGCVAATFMGGLLLDLVGVRGTLLATLGVTLLGACLFLFAIGRRR